MDTYKIFFTEFAMAQFREVYDYISCVLFSPEIAYDWSVRVEKKIQALEYMPERIRMTAESPWKERGVHCFAVENFYAYFIIDDDSKEVWITAFIYSKRDQKRQLQIMDGEC